MVDISGLSFKYPRSHDNSINNLSLNIARGEKILIAGRNGAGKTTLSKILSGLIPHVEQGELTGDYFYNGKDIRKCAHLDVIRDTAILLQDFESQIVSTTVREELVFYPMNLGVSYADALARAEKICLKFGLADMMEREINSLSGGEKQKIALLSLLSAEPKTLILDEPFTDIDPSSQKFFLDFLKSGFEGTVIAFEQTVDYYEYFDSVAVLDNGIVIKKGGKELAGDIATLEQAGIEAPEVFRIIGGFVDASAFAADNVRQNFVFDETSYGALDMPGIAGDELIRAEGITHKYPDSGTNAVDGVDIVLHRGDFRVVLGGNGSGKTTLMKILCGILPLKCKNGSKPVCSAGYVYQNPDNQIFAETVLEETAFILKTRGIKEDEARRRTFNVLDLMGLGEKSGNDPLCLSKGDREKVACASIINGEPELLIFDEPTTGLDAQSVESLMNIVCGLNSKGHTIIIITHSMETAARYGTGIIAMSDGKIVYDGPKRPFFNDDVLLGLANIKRTQLMDLSLNLNGKLLMNAEEFLMCWRKK